MSMPFYVAPEQVMKDRADYARKGIARGRSLVAVIYADGIVIVAENPSNTLRKITEIYDRIAFAGVGKYNEFDQLRIAGVRHADLKGYCYSREDVDARSLANQYAQILGQVFTHEMKPIEVEILVAEVGDDPDDDQLFHILYDGTVHRRERLHRPRRRGRGDRRPDSGRRGSSGLDLDAALAVGIDGARRPDRSCRPTTSRSPCSTARRHRRRRFRRLEADELPHPPRRLVAATRRTGAGGRRPRATVAPDDATVDPPPDRLTPLRHRARRRPPADASSVTSEHVVDLVVEDGFDGVGQRAAPGPTARSCRRRRRRGSGRPGRCPAAPRALPHDRPRRPEPGRRGHLRLEAACPR